MMCPCPLESSTAVHSRSEGFALARECPQPRVQTAAKPLLIQLGGALRHVHACGCAHRDIKPENVIFADSSRTQPKLCDFGFAVASSGAKLKDVCGSPLYMSPQLHKHVAYHGPPVDCWAFGALSYEVLHGRFAFTGLTMEQLQLRIIKGSHEPLSKSLSSAARLAVKALLAPAVEKRWTAEDYATKAWLPSASAAEKPQPATPREPAASDSKDADEPRLLAIATPREASSGSSALTAAHAPPGALTSKVHSTSAMS